MNATEIKFRAWDINRSIMIPWEKFKVMFNIQAFQCSWMIFMLFSGLRDKKGNEIYDGDCCKLINSGGWTGYGIVRLFDGCFEIVFKYPLWDPILRASRPRDYLKCWTINYAIEVIGNIYQNPDLVKEIAQDENCPTNP